ncbi:hypothetical protein FRC10_000326 [Ceratobasidium sp. 414]|nr:hypothetical protein FRC10_000326 [Ceratobasidium sp. 414]
MSLDENGNPRIVQETVVLKPESDLPPIQAGQRRTRTMSEFTFTMKNGSDFTLPASGGLMQRFWRRVRATGCVASVMGESGGHFQAGYWDVATHDRHFECVQLNNIVGIEFEAIEGWRGGTEPAILLKTSSFAYVLQYASQGFEQTWEAALQALARANSSGQPRQFRQHDVMTGQPPWWPVRSDWGALYDRHKTSGGESAGNGGGVAEGEGDADADAEGEEESVQQEQEIKDTRKRSRRDSAQRGTKRPRQSTSVVAHLNAAATTGRSQPEQTRSINEASSSRSANVDTSTNALAGPLRTSVPAPRSSQVGTTAAATTSQMLKLRISRPPDWESRRSAVAATTHPNVTPPQPGPSQEPQLAFSTPVIDRTDRSFDSNTVRWPFTPQHPESRLAASQSSTHAELSQSDSRGRENDSGSVDGSSARAPTTDDSCMSISSVDLSRDEPAAFLGGDAAMHEAPPAAHAELVADMSAYDDAQLVLTDAIASLNKPGVPSTGIATPRGTAAAASTSSAQSVADMSAHANAQLVLADAIASLNEPGIPSTGINTLRDTAAATSTSSAMDTDDPPPNVPASTSAMDVDDMLPGTPRTTSAVDNMDPTTVALPLAQPSVPLRQPSPVRDGHAVPDAANSNSTVTAAHVDEDGLRSRLVSIDIDRRTRPRPPQPA